MIDLALTGIIIRAITSLFPIAKKMFATPRIDVEIVNRGGGSRPEGISNKKPVSKQPIPSDEVIRVYRLRWDFRICLRNNSDVTAYYPTLVWSKQLGGMTIDNLNRLVPIKSATENILNGRFRKFEEVKARERTQISGLPSEFDDMSICIEYENSSKIKYYTVYGHSMQENKHFFRRPKQFRGLV